MSCRKRLNSDAKLDTDAITEYTHKKKKQMIYKCASSHTMLHTTLHNTHTTPHHTLTMSHNTHTTTSTGADGGAPRGVDEGHPRFSQEEVTALLHNQEQIFREILEEKLREQFNMFNQMYIDTIFKEYKNTDVSYIN